MRPQAPPRRSCPPVFFGQRVDIYYFFLYKRSNIESTNNMIKAKFGNNVRSKTWTAQVNEVLLKILCHNICVVIQEMHELGIEPIFSAQKVGEN